MLENKIKCTICKREFDINNMSHSKSYCKSCYKIYKRAWNNKNIEHIREYNKTYRELNRNKIINYKTAQRQKRQGYYIYIFRDYLDIPLYVGASTDIKTRLYNHLHYNSHIKDYLKLNEWEVVEVADLTRVLYNTEELRFIENYLIELDEPYYNQTLNNIQHINRDRIDELIDIAQDLHFYEYAYNENFETEYKKNMLI